MKKQATLFEIPADRKCSCCGEIKPLTEFYDWKTEQRKNMCRMCIRAQMREWRKENPDRVRIHASKSDKKNRSRVNAYHRKWSKAESSKEKHLARHLRRKYCLTIDDYDEMLKRQGGVCAICGTDQTGKDGRFNVDHCHRTGRVRGLLCKKCNLGIGLLGDGDFLEEAIEYIRQSEVENGK